MRGFAVDLVDGTKESVFGNCPWLCTGNIVNGAKLGLGSWINPLVFAGFHNQFPLPTLVRCYRCHISTQLDKNVVWFSLWVLSTTAEIDLNRHVQSGVWVVQQTSVRSFRSAVNVYLNCNCNWARVIWKWQLQPTQRWVSCNYFVINKSKIESLFYKIITQLF